jgi:hypothetical protein
MFHMVEHHRDLDPAAEIAELEPFVAGGMHFGMPPVHLYTIDLTQESLWRWNDVKPLSETKAAPRDPRLMQPLELLIAHRIVDYGNARSCCRERSTGRRTPPGAWSGLLGCSRERSHPGDR